MDRKFVYSIFDKKAKMYMDPFVAFRDEIAVRDLHRNVMNPDSALNLFSDDYRLVCLGTFGIVDGLLCESGEGPRVICEASAFKKSETV